MKIDEVPVTEAAAKKALGNMGGKRAGAPGRKRVQMATPTPPWRRPAPRRKPTGRTSRS